jgi:hypothetical protein
MMDCFHAVPISIRRRGYYVRLHDAIIIRCVRHLTSVLCILDTSVSDLYRCRMHLVAAMDSDGDGDHCDGLTETEALSVQPAA